MTYRLNSITAKRPLLIVLLLFISFHVFSQEDTTAVQDTVPVHSVRKATILSAALPGAGQIYNHMAMPKGKKKAFWKVPLIYGGLGALGFFVVDNHRTVLELRDQYNLIEDGGSATGIWNVYGTDKTAILAQHDQFARWRDFSIIGFVAVYAVQVIDAAVEAHFVNFDVTEDLSMRVSPTLMNQQSIGLKLSLNFR
ncbi:MAG: hypothetical protein Crog4KO_03640 [Crocinitomicaceae bacterium]